MNQLPVAAWVLSPAHLRTIVDRRDHIIRWRMDEEVRQGRRGQRVFFVTGGRDVAIEGIGIVQDVLILDEGLSGEADAEADSPVGGGRLLVAVQDVFDRPIAISGHTDSRLMSLITQARKKNVVPLDDEQAEMIAAYVRDRTKMGSAHAVTAVGETVSAAVSALSSASSITDVDEPVSPGSKGEGTGVLGDLRGRALSTSVSRILMTAADRAVARKQGPLLTSSYLVGAILSYALDTKAGVGQAFLRSVGGKVSDLKRIFEPFLESPATRHGAPSDLQVTNSVIAIFDHAEQLRRRVGSDRYLAARHLVAALITLPGSEPRAVRRLRSSGVDLKVARSEVLRALTVEAPESERAKWERILAAGGKPEGGGVDEQAGGSLISHFDADRADGRGDCLDVTGDAVAMANLLASKALEPPLAIGLFGDWGAGKSFFMAKLRDVVGKLAEGGRKGADAYWGNIRQVEFNAWHYADANLWASLVSHLFDQLREAPSEGGGDPADKVIERIVQATSAGAAAQEKLDRAKRELQSAQNERGRREEQFKRDSTSLAEAVSRSLWDRAVERFGAEYVGEDVRRELAAVGLAAADAKESIKLVHGQLVELGTTAGRLRAIILSCLTWPRAAWLLGAGIAIAGVSLLIGASGSEARDVFHGWSQLLIGVTGVLGWVTSGARRVSAAMGPLEKLRAELDRALKEAEEERVKAVAELSQQVDRAKAEVEDATKQVDQARRVRETAEAELQDVRSGKMIARFIEQRVTSGDYQKHLGLVAMVRKDFDTLSRSVERHNGGPRGDVRGTPVPDVGVNRIVLYIDDLDRCPPDRVVEVLEAVHLLLAFRLFVVVVGVDVRWVARSLERKYKGMLELDSVKGSPAAGARPDDYLEKIFQIPYWIRPMDTAGSQALIRSLIKRDGTEAGGHDRHLEFLEGATADTQAAGDDPPVDGRKFRQGSSPDDHGSVSSGETGRGVEPIAKPERLRLDQAEGEDMEALAPLLGRSPRAAKRFVNTFRLLKAATRPGEAGGRSGGRSRMLLLAIATGCPRIAPDIFNIIEHSDPMAAGQTFGEVLRQAAPLDQDSGGDWTRLLGFLSSPGGVEWADVPVNLMGDQIGRVRQFTFGPMFAGQPVHSSAGQS